MSTQVLEDSANPTLEKPEDEVVLSTGLRIAGEGSTGLNPNAAQFTPSSFGGGEQQPAVPATFPSYTPFTGEEYSPARNDIMMTGPFMGGQRLPFSGASKTPSASAIDEIAVLKRLPYRAKVLPPPLPFATHKRTWIQNMFKQDIAYEAEFPINESDVERTQRLQAYKHIMDRWHQHVVILDEKRDNCNALNKIPCKSYNAMVSLTAADAELDEDVLKAWSDECVRWWQESCKRRVKKPKKKRTDEALEQMKISTALGQLDLTGHPTVLTADLIGQCNHQSFLFPSTDLQFDDQFDDQDVDEDDASDVIASELLLQFED